jgi:transposase-like protein
MALEPTNLQEAILYFADADNCLTYLVARRWPDGVVVCPTCGRKNPRYIAERKVWQCSIKHPKRQFSVKVGTIFEDSPLGLDKWLPAVWLITSCKNGVSSYEIMRGLGVTQKTAWFMLQRIRLGLQSDSGMLSGEVEVDESFIGGKSRNMHFAKRREKIQGRGPTGKAVVMGMLQRGGKVKATVVADREKATLQPHVHANVAPGSNVFTDELVSYWGLDEKYVHEIINHAEQYVRGNVHTNGMENFWSLLKRGLSGTYVSVEPFHLFRYIDEQAFRYNNRKHESGKPMTDAERCSIAVTQAVGKRLTWNELTGKENTTQPEAF